MLSFCVYVFAALIQDQSEDAGRRKKNILLSRLLSEKNRINKVRVGSAGPSTPCGTSGLQCDDSLVFFLLFNLALLGQASLCYNVCIYPVKISFLKVLYHLEIYSDSVVFKLKI